MTPNDRPAIVSFPHRKVVVSQSLGSAELSELSAAIKSVPWYRDRWSFKPFRRFLTEFMVRSAPAGLVLLGPRIRFPVPAPFDELFEPIELRHGLGLGGTDPQLQTLSGAAPTREERQKKIALFVLSPIVVCGVGLFVLGLLRLGAIMLPVAMLVVIAVVGGLALASALMRIGGRWFLVPGGVAIVHGHGTPEQQLVLRTRRDAPALIRYISNGKSVMLVIELWSQDGRKWRRPVSDREAISFLAAWQSAEPTPSVEQLREALGVAATDQPR